MNEKKSYQSWTISDEFWEAVKDRIPVKKRDPKKNINMRRAKAADRFRQEKFRKEYFTFYAQGASGRLSPGSTAARAAFIGITRKWVAAGFFKAIWALGLTKYDELQGIGWEWQSLDGCIIKAPLAREAVGHNPTDRGKNGDKEKHSDR